MTITTNRTLLASALDRCAKVTPSRSTQPILAHTLLVASEGRLTYRATNLQCEASGSMAAVGSGSVCVSPKELASAIAGLTGDTVTLSPAAGHVSVTGSTKRSFKLATLSADDFPAPMAVDGSTHELPAETLSGLIASVAFAARQDADRPEQHCVHLEPWKGLLRATTADGGRRVATRDIALASDIRLNIPLPVANMLAGIKSGVVTLTCDDRGMAFQHGDERLAAMIPVGDFPPINSHLDLLPRGASVTLAAEQLLESVRALWRVDPEQDVRLSFTAGLLVVECTGKGSARDEIECPAVTPYEVWLPADQLSDALGAVSGDVTLSYGPGELDPFWIAQGGWQTLMAPIKPESVAARKR